MNVPPLLPSDPPPALPPVLAEPAATPAPRVKAWRWWIHLLLIAAYPLLIGVVGLGVGEATGPALSNNARGLLLVSAEQLLIFGLLFGVAWLASRATREDLLWRWRGGFWPVPLGIGYSVALRLAVGLLAGVVVGALVISGAVTLDRTEEFVLKNRPDVESVVDVPAMRQDPVYYWLTLTVVSFVVAGFREELWRVAFLAGMRALWPQRFGSRAGQMVAVLIAAVIFGLGHLPQGVIAVGLTGLLGVGLGAIMVFHRSIWPAVIAHGMFDATSLALIPWALDLLQEVQRKLGH